MVKIFSGARPSGKLHLGNYFGALKNWVDLQNKADRAIFGVVDYHGITTPYDPATYHQQIADVTLDFLAAGLKPDAEKIMLIRQSKIPQHTELAWILNTITPVSWLDRLPTYREQLSKTKYNNMGLLDYPVLMAADILVYKSNMVPAGEDQLPHIDLTNEIAKKFNSMFGETFEPVKAQLTKGARIMSLQDPSQKMSKTGDESIALIDSADEIRAKIKKAVTDSDKEIIFKPEEKPAISNLIMLYHLMSDEEIETIEQKYSGKTYVEFKNDLAEVIINYLKPFQEKRQELTQNINSVMSSLEKSEEAARTLANATLQEVRTKLGLE